MGLQRACVDSRPKPPKRSRTFQRAIAPGAFNPWSRTLGVLGDALWNVLDHFKALAILQPPTPQRRVLESLFFWGGSLRKPSGYSRVYYCLGGPGGRANMLPKSLTINSRELQNEANMDPTCLLKGTLEACFQANLGRRNRF